MFCQQNKSCDINFLNLYRSIYNEKRQGFMCVLIGVGKLEVGQSDIGLLM